MLVYVSMIIIILALNIYNDAILGKYSINAYIFTTVYTTHKAHVYIHHSYLVAVMYPSSLFLMTSTMSLWVLDREDISTAWVVSTSDTISRPAAYSADGV